MNRFLYKVNLDVNSNKNEYFLRCKPLNSIDFGAKSKQIVFRGSETWFRNQLMKMKVNDNVKEPVSKNRAKTYNKMIQDAKDGTDNLIYIWSNNLPNKIIINESFLDADNVNAKEWLGV